ncbi:hypothetical protein Tco_1070549 [Tanacetum coccineum]|uniref:Uncharacterized protein n=1 Tax=Tanacetum coccineum TaxID=301880 RepID=A0ABQ5HLR0_9ASTR
MTSLPLPKLEEAYILFTKYQMFLKSLCSSFGTPSRRSKTHNLMNSFCPTRSALSVLKSLEIFWISVQECKGMFYRENVDSPELIWEDFAFQIDHKKEKKSRRETMPFPRFTKVIINHFLKQHKSLSNLKYQHYHTIKDDGIVSKLKFVRIGEDYHEYRLAIPDVMLNDTIVQLESYEMFIKYSTGQIPPKKSRGKGSQGNKTVDVSQETIDVSEEHCFRVSRSTRSVVIQDTPSSPKPKLDASKPKLKGVQSLTPKEQEVADVMQALKESKKTSSRQPSTGGSSEGTSRIPGVLDESTVISATSSKGTGTKPGVTDEEKVSTEEKVILKWGSEQESKYSEEDLNKEEEIDWIDSKEDDEKKDDTDDDKSIDLEMTDDEETDDEVLQGKEQVNDDEDEEMTNAEVEDSRKGDAKISNVAKVDVEKTDEVKDDSKKVELPPTSSSLSVSLGFGDQFLKLSSDTSLTGTVKDTTDAEISSLLEIKIQSEVPHIQSLSVLKVPMSVISEPSVLTPEQETPSAAPITTLLLHLSPSYHLYLHNKQQHQSLQHQSQPMLQPSPLLFLNPMHSLALATLKSQAPTVFEQYLGSKIGDYLQKVLQRHTANLIQKYSVKLAPEKHNDDDDDEDPPAGPNQGKKTKRRRTKELESSKKPSSTKETPKGKALSKGSKTGKSTSAKEPVEEPIAEVTLDWNNPEGGRYPFDLSKPLPLQGHPGHLTIVADYFFNNDLEYLKSSDPERTYTTLITKTKEAWYEIVSIEDMVPTHWSTIKYAYDKDATKGIKHWGERHKLWYKSQMNTFSKQNVCFTQKIIGVNSVIVKKLHGYGHLEEVVVKRADRQVYKFKEGDFVDLHLNDIEDMLILDVQHKLFYLNDSGIVDFIVALHMFTRSLVIKRRVEDLQLGSMKKKDQISFDEETALKLHVEFDEEERLAREKGEKVQEANISLIETWDDIQEKIDVDHQLAERIEAQKKRVNMEGYKFQDLKSKGFDSIQETFDRALKRVNTFEDFRTELVEGKEKRAGTKLS